MASAEAEEQVRFPVLRGGWLTISFLHWRHDADVIQAMLPDGLEVDTYDGSAWVSMTPFVMADQPRREAPHRPGLLHVACCCLARAAGRARRRSITLT